LPYTHLELVIFEGEGIHKESALMCFTAVYKSQSVATETQAFVLRRRPIAIYNNVQAGESLSFGS
jgi:hypothetical protein